MFGAPVMTRTLIIYTNCFSLELYIIRNADQNKNTGSTWVLDKHNEKKTNFKKIMIFPCTNTNRKFINTSCRKARQERYCNTKINVTNRSQHSTKGTRLIERVWKILVLEFLNRKRTVSFSVSFLYRLNPNWFEDKRNDKDLRTHRKI